MSMLRIVVGFRTDDYRNEVPAVLGMSRDADVAQAVAEKAGGEFVRIELIESRGGQRLRKQSPVLNGVEFGGAAIRQALGGSEPATPPSEPAPPSLLEGLTISELEELCDETGIDRTGFKVKADFITALALDDQLSELTIPELREKAVALEIDVKGLSRKREFLDALEAHERAAVKEAARNSTPQPAPAASGPAERSAAFATESPQPPPSGAAAEGAEEGTGPSVEPAKPRGRHR